MNNKKRNKTILGVFLALVLSGLWWFNQPQTLAQTASVLVTVTTSPLSLDLATRPRVPYGRIFNLITRVDNLGESEIVDIEAYISLPGGLEVIGNPTKRVGILKGHHHRNLIWSIRANDQGVYIIQVDAQGTMMDTKERISISDTTIVEVTSIQGIIRFLQTLFNTNWP